MHDDVDRMFAMMQHVRQGGTSVPTVVIFLSDTPCLCGHLLAEHDPEDGVDVGACQDSACECPRFFPDL
jgi:hypothetical protein